MIEGLNYTVYTIGDHAITIELGSSINVKTNELVIDLFRHLQQKKSAEIKDIIPAYSSVSIVFDLILLYQKNNTNTENRMQQSVAELLLDFKPGHSSFTRKIKIPVCYDVCFGIDLQEMSNQKQVSIEELIRLHTAQTYRVYMIGFLPGFAYMGKVHEKLITSRKPQPRRSVDAGSVGIAAEQTGIYPFASPGGWNIIGQTPLQLFNPARKESVLLQAGDEVQFERIDINTFYQIKNDL